MCIVLARTSTCVCMCVRVCVCVCTDAGPGRASHNCLSPKVLVLVMDNRLAHNCPWGQSEALLALALAVVQQD